MYYTTLSSPFCEIILVGDEDGLSHLHLNSGVGRPFAVDPAWRRAPVFFQEVEAQIRAFFAGERRHFDLKLNPGGTEFQQSVWRALREIPFGARRSYRDIAVAVGRPGASRAVGAANGRNPIPLIIPCHRVVGSSGKLTGFAHGLALKAALIHWESDMISGDPSKKKRKEDNDCCDF